MATHQKVVAFKSAFAAQVFADMLASVYCVNGRLKGYTPTPTGATGYIISGQRIYFNVTLSALSSDDDTVPNATVSAAIANGVLLLTTGAVAVNTIYTSTGTPESEVANPDDPFYIYADYDDNEDSNPTFSVAKLSEIDAAPRNKAKLAYFDPESQAWTRSPAVSIKSIYDMAVSAISTRGGFAVSISDEQAQSATLEVGPGSITASKNRVVSLSSKLIDYTDRLPETAGRYRRDLIVLVDPLDESITPQIEVIEGFVEGAAPEDVPNPPAPTSQLQIPLASVLVKEGTATDTSLISVTDMRPDFAWQTDSVSASHPVATEQINSTATQPGLVMTDDSLVTPVGWFSGLFQSRVEDEDIFVVGKLGDEVTKILSVSADDVAVSGSEFPPAPYILRSSVTIEDITAGTAVDITRDPNFVYELDYLNGVFSDTLDWTVAPSFPRILRVKFKQVEALFTIEPDGTIGIPELASIRTHLLASNSAAHTASNILYSNTGGEISSALAGPLSTQEAIRLTAAQAFGTSGGGGGGGTTVINQASGTSLTYALTTHASATEWGMGIGAAAATTVAKKTPFYAVPRSGVLSAASFAFEAANTIAATTATLKVYVNGAAAPAYVGPAVTVATSPYTAASKYAFGFASGLTTAVTAGDHVTCVIELDAASALASGYFANAVLSIDYA